MSISPRQREEVRYRSYGMCEALIDVGVWTRCGRSPVEIHHMLTRARGGNLLDDADETYHLIALCREHHAWADGGQAYEAGLLIDGYVNRNGTKIIYSGTDEYLTEKYHG